MKNGAGMDDIAQEIGDFEQKLLEAIRFKYRAVEPAVAKSLVEQSVFSRIDIAKFHELYRQQTQYPSERLSKLVHQLMDIKVQLYLVVEIDLGLYNELIYRRFLVENIDANPYLGLIRLSIDQSVVVKSRILWERIMNFVYYLETGEDLETKKSKKQSKKAEFFEYTRESAENKWSYLADYEPYVNWFDEKLRTPEVHKGSTLRGHFVAGEAVNSVGVLSLLNISANVFWQGLFEIIQGRDVHFKLRLPALDALLGGNETTAGTHHAV